MNEILMGKIKKVRDERRNIIRMLQDKQEEKVQKYLEKENEKLYKQELKLTKKIYRQEKYDEYSSCKHIWVNSLIADDGDYHRHNSRNYCGCIKCGLNQAVLHSAYPGGEDCLPLTERVMYDFILENPKYLNRISANVTCDLELGKAIYAKIKEAHPDIDDDTARKYFEIALDHIVNIKVSDERKAKRAKRLSLDSNFNKWPTK